jgi:molecular chaperone GrpE
LSKQEQTNTAPDQEEILEEQAQVEQPEEEAAQQTETPDPMLAELEALKDQTAQQEEKYLRLCAEYDNYRKRTAREKESIWTDVKVETVSAFLPVYDNLERALKQDTADEAFKKGVEMTMNQLKEVLNKLGVTEIQALGQTFDPNLHNAVMHVEDENLGENVVAEVFQSGFQCGEKVIRFAMVKVAN